MPTPTPVQDYSAELESELSDGATFTMGEPGDDSNDELVASEDNLVNTPMVDREHQGDDLEGDLADQEHDLEDDLPGEPVDNLAENLNEKSLEKLAWSDVLRDQYSAIHDLMADGGQTSDSGAESRDRDEELVDISKRRREGGGRNRSGNNGKGNRRKNGRQRGKGRKGQARLKAGVTGYSVHSSHQADAATGVATDSINNNEVWYPEEGETEGSMYTATPYPKYRTCSELPCKRGGRCVPDNMRGGVRCQCKLGTQGDYCDQGTVQSNSENW